MSVLLHKQPKIQLYNTYKLFAELRCDQAVLVYEVSQIKSNYTVQWLPNYNLSGKTDHKPPADTLTLTPTEEHSQYVEKLCTKIPKLQTFSPQALQAISRDPRVHSCTSGLTSEPYSCGRKPARVEDWNSTILCSVWKQYTYTFQIQYCS